MGGQAWVNTCLDFLTFNFPPVDNGFTQGNDPGVPISISPNLWRNSTNFSASVGKPPALRSPFVIREGMTRSFQGGVFSRFHFFFATIPFAAKRME